MSSNTIGLNDNLRKYLLDVSCRESKTLKDLREETSLLKESQMQISPEQGSFLSFLVNIINAKKTLDEAKNKLIELYKDELISPEIDLTLIFARPVRVSLIGEVERPGSYTFQSTETSRVASSGSEGTVVSGFKTVVDAIQKAGGLTLDADITKVKLFRKLPGGKEEFKKTELDLLNMIRTGNQNNNPIIFILVPRADNMKISAKSFLSESNIFFSPLFVKLKIILLHSILAFL